MLLVCFGVNENWIDRNVPENLRSQTISREVKTKEGKDYGQVIKYSFGQGVRKFLHILSYSGGNERATWGLPVL